MAFDDVTRALSGPSKVVLSYCYMIKQEANTL